MVYQYVSVILSNAKDLAQGLAQTFSGMLHSVDLGPFRAST